MVNLITKQRLVFVVDDLDVRYSALCFCVCLSVSLSLCLSVLEMCGNDLLFPFFPISMESFPFLFLFPFLPVSMESFPFLFLFPFLPVPMESFPFLFLFPFLPVPMESFPFLFLFPFLPVSMESFPFLFSPIRSQHLISVPIFPTSLFPFRPISIPTASNFYILNTQKLRDVCIMLCIENKNYKVTRAASFFSILSLLFFIV